MRPSKQLPAKVHHKNRCEMHQIRTVLILTDGEVSATDWLSDDNSDATTALMLDAVRSIIGRRRGLAAAFWERRRIRA